MKYNMSNRQKYNLKILNELQDYFIKYPDIRFNQALINLKLMEDNKNLFNVESEKTYNELNKNNSDNKNDNDKNSISKLSLNEFYTIIRNNCANVICNYFYDNYEHDNRSIIINKIYRYLCKNLITYNIDIINYINNLFNELPTYELNNSCLDNIHLFIISKLFNTYIKLKYNKEFKLNDNIYNNAVKFSFKEIPNLNYHGSIKDESLYELTYNINIIKELDEKAQTFLQLYNEIKEFLDIKTQNFYFQNYDDLYNKFIFKLNDIYVKELDALMAEIK